MMEERVSMCIIVTGLFLWFESLWTYMDILLYMSFHERRASLQYFSSTPSSFLHFEICSTLRRSSESHMATDMDVDGEQGSTRRVLTAADKGKGKVVDEAPLGAGAAMPWVEKYRPKSLADVAAHKDIVDTSEKKRVKNHT